MVGNSNKQFQVKTSVIALSYSYEKSINIADNYNTSLEDATFQKVIAWHIKPSLSYKNNEFIFTCTSKSICPDCSSMLAYHIRSASGFDNIISKNPGF
jgi:hypothetical protein